MHPEHVVCTVELIFAHLLTSTNYHSGEKLTGGKNGYGAKLANVFSHRFEVETCVSEPRNAPTHLVDCACLTRAAPKSTSFTTSPSRRASAAALV